VVTIVGNGMGEYNFANIGVDYKLYDRVLCDKSFTQSGKNILKLGFKEIKEYIEKNYKYEDILYVVTGSPLFFSAGILVAKKLPKNKVKIINNTSSRDYILNKLLINDSEVNSISLHGRKNFNLEQFLKNKYTLVLCDAKSIARLQKAMQFFDMSRVDITIGYKLGYKDEKIEKFDIFSQHSFDLSKPFILLLKKDFEQKTISLDSDFKTERGMITKSYKRNLSLQNLDLKPNQILWDVGAGSGSCGIEAFKRYSVKVEFFEKNVTRVENIKENLMEHNLIDCSLHIGDASNIFEEVQENPDRIFLGGGGESVINKIPYLYERLNENGIILINAITLKHLNLMLNELNKNKILYEVFSLSLTTYKGLLDLVEPERQLFQIKVKK
jgi:precorrin-6Y C5,15-methyltransferase (decarboxylating)